MHIINPTPSRKELIASGLIGLVGALLLFAGDMLMYGHLGSGMAFYARQNQVIANASTIRLFAAGALGPISLLGYLPGALHLYWRLRPCPSSWRAITAIGLAVTFILAGAEHVVLGSFAVAVRAEAALPTTEPLRVAIGQYEAFIYRLATMAGYPTLLLLLVLVLIKKTTYPRWTALLNPGLLMLLSPLAVHIPAPLGAVFVGGFYNLTFSAFFLISLVTLNSGMPMNRLQPREG